MIPRRFAIAATAIGEVGFVWTARGIAGIQLPGRDARETLALVGRRFPGATPGPPEGDAALAIEAVRALLRGEPADLSGLPLDLDGVPDFDGRVYAVALTIPRGETLTYGAVAARIGEPGAARAVGAALGRNPVPIIVPCHRVLAAGGRTGGFTAPGGIASKLRLLAIEGVAPGGQPDLFA